MDPTPALCELAKVIGRAPSADNSQPWRINFHDNSLTLSYDSSRVAGRTFDPTHPATLLAIGAAIENAMQAARAWGMNPGLRLANDLPDSAGIYAWIHASDTDKPTVSAQDQACYQRHTNRCTYSDEALPPALLQQLSSLREGRAAIQILDQKPAIKEAARLVDYASRIRFQRKDAHAMLMKSLRLRPDEAAQGDGLDLATLGLPPGGGLFLKTIASWRRMQWLNQLGAYRLLAAIDAGPVASAPALLAITGPGDKLGALSAGQLLCRVWTELNSQEIAVHPYYVISDQMQAYDTHQLPDSLRASGEVVSSGCRALLQLNEGTTLHMLLRIGYPKRRAVASQRLPPERVCEAFPDQA